MASSQSGGPKPPRPRKRPQRTVDAGDAAASPAKRTARAPRPPSLPRGAQPDPTVLLSSALLRRPLLSRSFLLTWSRLPPVVLDAFLEKATIEAAGLPKMRMLRPDAIEQLPAEVRVAADAAAGGAYEERATAEWERHTRELRGRADPTLENDGLLAALRPPEPLAARDFPATTAALANGKAWSRSMKAATADTTRGFYFMNAMAHAQIVHSTPYDRLRMLPLLAESVEANLKRVAAIDPATRTLQEAQLLLGFGFC